MSSRRNDFTGANDHYDFWVFDEFHEPGESTGMFDIPTSAPATTIAATAKSKENPYTKPGVGKCYMCGEYGHKSNECSKRKKVNMTDDEDDEEEEFENEESNNFDFVDEHGEFVICVVQRLLCNQKAPDTTQRHQIFYSRCSVKSKICQPHY